MIGIWDGYMLYRYGRAGGCWVRLRFKRIRVNGASLGVAAGGNYGYFGGRLLNVQDRVGSARSGQSFFPYGETKTGVSTADALSFATYSRDGSTGLDYADQRFYANQWGRFISPDPAIGSVAPSNPQSWNRYSYVINEPVNSQDPEGLCSVIIGGVIQTAYTNSTVTRQEFADEVGAISAFPYAGGIRISVADMT